MIAFDVMSIRGQIHVIMRWMATANGSLTLFFVGASRLPDPQHVPHVLCTITTMKAEGMSKDIQSTIEDKIIIIYRQNWANERSRSSSS